MTTTEKIKRDLWRNYGVDPMWKAEWDGKSYGAGGKLSQRMWEYFISAELMNLDANSVVLDIGGGSPFSGMPFFAELIAPHVKQVIVIDPNQPEGARQQNIKCVLENASEVSLARVFREYRDISHVCSISVFEHISQDVRIEIIKSINEHFNGDSFVATYEYHPTRNHFEHQLTATSASQMFVQFKRFFLETYLASPSHCINAFSTPDNLLSGLAARILRRLKIIRHPRELSGVPLWYPCAVRFVRGEN